MLEIVNYNEGEYEFPCLLVLGCFDGLHIGHAELLKKAKLQAKINGLDLGVMMFADGKGGKQVYSFEERVALLEQFNVKFVLKIDFTNEFKNTKPLDFLQVIEDKLNVKAYMSGKDFRFGAGAKGKSSTLKNYCEDEENGVWYMSVKDVLSGSDKVSTTLIKTLLENGDIPKANELLGREYSISGIAEANGAAVSVTYPENKIKLKEGNYSVKCTVGENEYCGAATVGNGLQVSLDGCDGNVDGQTITVKFLACGEVSEETLSQPEAEIEVAQKNSAIEELAVSEEPENNTETEIAVEPEVTDVAEPAVEETQEIVAEEPAEVPEENISEDTEFEDELEEAFEETSEEVSETVEETTEDIEVTQPEEEISENLEADESYTLTETAEELQETTEEVIEQPVEEETIETVEEQVVEEITEEAPAEEVSEEITEESVEETTEETAEEVAAEEVTEEVSDGGENND